MSAGSWRIGAAAAGLAALWLSGCKEPNLGRELGGGPSVETGAVLSAIAGYREWRKLNAERLAVPTAKAVLCGPQKAADPQGTVNYVNVFASDISIAATERFLTNPKFLNFPFGTVLVKERYSKAGQDTPDLLVVMIKRGFEYNSDYGNWEFSVVSGDGKKVLEYGRLKHCGACHAQAKSHDYVIGSFP